MEAKGIQAVKPEHEDRTPLKAQVLDHLPQDGGLAPAGSTNQEQQAITRASREALQLPLAQRGITGRSNSVSTDAHQPAVIALIRSIRASLRIPVAPPQSIVPKPLP